MTIATMNVSTEERVFYTFLDWTLEEVPRVFYVGFGGEIRVKNLRRNVHHTNKKSQSNAIRAGWYKKLENEEGEK